ncbi:hypothetical protein SAMN05216349_10818 [Oribacterium sp. KHPX15]|uniref:hypothetical protein n=1 Tax=unclassified Oribacterium TaxID=2629782 RepID=UPI0004E16219|nr:MULTISPECIES: hypothetical protein [unclassified Oribacterium]SEA26604.1 hypothetical protein SAMN05216349_10818 [Oribacterium sp. KHPX15]
MSYQAIEGVARYDNQERISTENRWQQYLDLRSRNNQKLDQTNQSESRKFQNETSEQAKEENRILFERPNQQNLDQLKRKADSGQKLTSDEKAYLQQYDPDSYRKVTQREQEVKEYKRILKQAKSKEEIRNAKIHYSDVAYRNVDVYADSTYTLDSDYLVDEERSTYDRVV